MPRINVNYSALARRLGVSPQATRNMFAAAKFPPRRVIPVCEALGWAVTPHELRPDLYPNITDGTPHGGIST